MNLERITGYASPFDGMQAPDHLTLGHTTGLDLPSETKFFPFAKPNKAPHKPCPSVALDPLPSFPFGVVPIFPHQQNSDLRQRGFDGPKVVYDGSMISADLADAFAMLKDSGKRMAAPLSDAYVGSPWDYGPREGRPFGTTDGNNFVLEYHDTLKEKELVRRADKLIKDGYDAKRVLKVMEDAMDADIMEKLKRR